MPKLTTAVVRVVATAVAMAVRTVAAAMRTPTTKARGHGDRGRDRAGSNKRTKAAPSMRGGSNHKEGPKVSDVYETMKTIGKITNKCDVILLYLRYGIYDPPIPAAFILYCEE